MPTRAFPEDVARKRARVLYRVGERRPLSLRPLEPRQGKDRSGPSGALPSVRGGVQGAHADNAVLRDVRAGLLSALTRRVGRQARLLYPVRAAAGARY